MTRRFRDGETVLAYPPLSTEQDEHGNEVIVWGDAVEVDDCAFALESEPTGEPHRSAVVDTVRLWGPYDALVEKGWKVDVPGVGSFVVNRKVERWKNPHNGRRPGFAAHLQDVEG